MSAAEVWTAVAEERLALADRLAGLEPGQWDAASQCDGWRVRDVTAHLVWLAEATIGSFLRESTLTMLRHRCGPFASMGPIAVALGARPPGELVDRLRAASGGRFVVPGASTLIALGEVVTHGLDITRPLGLPDTVAAERMAGVLETYRATGFAFGTGRRARRVTLVPAETDVRIGEGPAVTGPAGDLVLALAGRAPAPGALGGPGLPLLLPGVTRVRS